MPKLWLWASSTVPSGRSSVTCSSYSHGASGDHQRKSGMSKGIFSSLKPFSIQSGTGLSISPEALSMASVKVSPRPIWRPVCGAVRRFSKTAPSKLRP